MKVTTAGGQFYYMADINRVVYADDVRHKHSSKRWCLDFNRIVYLWKACDKVDSGTFFLENGYVVASIMVSKYKLFGEAFVTWKELNYIINELQKEYNEKDINVCIITSIDEGYFDVGGAREVITLKDRSINDVEHRYKLFVNVNISKILWDDNFISKKLMEFKKQEIVTIERHVTNQ